MTQCQFSLPLWLFLWPSHRLRWLLWRISFPPLLLLREKDNLEIKLSGAQDDQSFLNSAAIQYRLLPLPGNLRLEFDGISIEVVNTQFKLLERNHHKNVKHMLMLKINLPIMFPSSPYLLFPRRSMKLKSFMKMPLTFFLFMVSRISSWVSLLILESVSSV